jgi:DNA replicative helicase MCM subunit Mcm2 (Cdc46/Mcm family)
MVEALAEALDHRERFVNLLKTFQDRKGAYKYREALADMASAGRVSLTIDFDDLISFDADLASELKDKPNEILPKANAAVGDAMRVENMLYASKVKNFKARFKGLDETVPLRSLKSQHMGRLIMLQGIITRQSNVKQQLKIGVFQCPRCNEKMVREQTGTAMNMPTECENPDCGRKGFFRLIPEESTFVDFQMIYLQEKPEELPPGQIPRSVEAVLTSDLVDISRAGDRISLVGVLLTKQEYTSRGFKLSTFSTSVEANYVEISEKEAEEVAIGTDDERAIKDLSQDPNLYKKIIGSVAPSIYGYEEIKEAIAYQLAGGVAKIMPDGIKIRGDINILLVGDPGCLVADERVILGDGRIAKIGQMGQAHLQPLAVQVQTGQGVKRAVATTFHMYPKQPVMEIITETGKSIKGTYNHPLLRVSNEGGILKREWCRLDELQLGDRLAVITGFQCTKTAYIDTGFAPIARNRYGPKFHRKLPKKVTPELAAFLGYMLGDGWVCKDGYRFGFVVAETDKDLLPPLLSLAERLFSITDQSISNVVKKGRTVHLNYVYLSDKDIAANLSFLKVKRVPDLILNSGNNVVASFLKWLYEADGCVFNYGHGRRAVALKAKDIELLRDVQLLLLRFGIHSRIMGNALVIRRGYDILKFKDHIGFAGSRKKSVLEKLAVDAESFKRFHKQRSERIVKIVKGGYADVYDIEVPEGNRFVANGIISHNTAKSQMLQYIARIAPRGVYTSGKGSTAAGLTATVARDKNTNEFFLEAGALVLGDKGIACIDEIDKMRAEDRSAIHEAMEQQTISIAKAGIVVQLNARCSILAAANPAFGRYVLQRTIAENIKELPVTILSRFDLIFTLLDKPEEAKDRSMTEHILNLHKGIRDVKISLIEPSLLKKYLFYARKNISPKISDEASQKIEEFFLGMRSKGQEADSPVPITMRQLEAVIRLSEARAKLALRNEVTKEDVDQVTRLVKSFLTQVGVDQSTGKLDIDTLMVGRPKSASDKMQQVFDVLMKMERENDGGPIKRDQFLERADVEGVGRNFAERTIETWLNDGTIYEPKPGFIKKT